MGPHDPRVEFSSLEEERNRDGAHHQIPGQIQIHIGRNFAPGHRALESANQRPSTSKADGLKNFGQFRVVGALPGQTGQNRGKRGGVEGLDIAAQHFLEIFAEIAGIEIFHARQPAKSLDSQGQFGRPAPVDGRLAHLCSAGHALDGQG